MEPHWQPADHVAFRQVGAGHGELWGRPAVVVADDHDCTVLYFPAGTPVARVDMKDGFRPLEPLHNRMGLLRLIPRDRPYSVTLFFEAGVEVPSYWSWLAPSGHCRGWKIDIETPSRRTSIGFDTTDNSLDLVRRPGEAWLWKDEAVTDRLRADGVFSAAELRSFYETGRAALDACEAGDALFHPAWEQWRPDDTWSVPELPDGWWLEPGADINLNHGRHFTWRWPSDQR
ncbi:MAG: hypothetical protein GEU80_05535 [Dehalococcoidia bacterium]|nr:hypothetical protein [Dehalococcoidia bacterium]